MSAAVYQPGLVNGNTGDTEAHHPIKHNGQNPDHLQPVGAAQERLDAGVRKKTQDGDHTRGGGAVQPAAAPSSSVTNGSHLTHIACESGQRNSFWTPSESEIGSPDSGNRHDIDQRPEPNGDHEQKNKSERRKGLPSPLDLRKTVSNGLGLLLSPASTSGKLSEIPEETSKRRSSQVDSPAMQGLEKEKILKLSPAQIQELTSSPKSLPLLAAPEESERCPINRSNDIPLEPDRVSARIASDPSAGADGHHHVQSRKRAGSAVVSSSTFEVSNPRGRVPLLPAIESASSTSVSPRPGALSRTVSTPTNLRRKHPATKQNGAVPNSTPQSRPTRTSPAPLQFDDSSKSTLKSTVMPDPMPSPMPISIPMPPLSIPTYLQLELSSDRPSPLYIHRSVTSDFPYESSRVKLERLQNFLLLPPQLEQVLWFGALACLDAWLYSFTILPLRFLKALYVLGQSWGHNLALELRFVSEIVFAGTGRMWRRRRGKKDLSPAEPSRNAAERSDFKRTSPSHSTNQRTPVGLVSANAKHSHGETERKQRRGSAFKHRRTKSTPSALMPDHKADLLKGLLVLFSCSILMYFDASRMYHSIRGQAAIKLYVIYNVLEVSYPTFPTVNRS